MVLAMLLAVSRAPEPLAWAISSAVFVVYFFVIGA